MGERVWDEDFPLFDAKFPGFRNVVKKFLKDGMFDFSRHPADRTPAYYHDKRAGNIFYGITDGVGPWTGFALYSQKKRSFLGKFESNRPYDGEMFTASIEDPLSERRYTLAKGKKSFDSLERQDGNGRRLQELMGHSTISRLLREERRATA